MSTLMSRIALILAVFAAGAIAQETPTAAEKPAAEKAVEAPEKGKKPKVEPVESAEIVKGAKKKADARRVLKPEEVPGELLRLKTKADIKAELKIRTTSGRPVTFSGVIRNGKLIERIIDKRFAPQTTVAHPRCGVRIWWAGDSDGYIFFRYSTIETLSITGTLSAKERAEIMRRLKAKRDGLDPDAAKKAAAEEEAKRYADIEKMSPKERGEYLMARYPLDKGWNGKRYRELRRKMIVENVKLSPVDEIFVKYYRVLEQVRFHSLRDAVSKKEEFEPGSAESDDGEQPSSEEDEK